MSRIRERHHRRLEALQQELRREDEIIRPDEPDDASVDRAGVAPVEQWPEVADLPLGVGADLVRRGGDGYTHDVSKLLVLVASLLCTLIGIVFIAAGDSVAISVVGLALASVGGVVLMLLAFYAVGQSEDRERRERGR